MAIGPSSQRCCPVWIGISLCGGTCILHNWMDTLSILILIYICDNQISFTPCFEKAVKACATTTLFNPLAFRVLFVCLSFYCSNLKQKNCCFLADLIFYSWLIYSSFVKQQKQEPLVSREFARLNNVEGNPKFFRQNDPLWKMFDLPKLFTFSPFPRTNGPRSAHDLLYSFSAEHQVLFSMVRWLSFWGSWPNGLFRAHQNTTGPGCIEAIAHWLVSVWEDLQNWCCRLCWSVVLWCYCWHHCMVGLSKNFGCCSWEPKEGYKVFLCLLAEVVSASWLSAFSGTPCKVLSLRLVSSAPQMEAKLFLWWNPIKNQFMWKKNSYKNTNVFCCHFRISTILW